MGQNKGSGVPLRDDQTITVIVSRNPKIEGTAAHHMFNQYQWSKTIVEYVNAVRATADERRRLGLPARADQGRVAIRWDLARGFIRLGD